ncbi:hypothetical protein HPB47_010075, partial [Ixodes persulcatus]
ALCRLPYMTPSQSDVRKLEAMHRWVLLMALGVPGIAGNEAVLSEAAAIPLMKQADRIRLLQMARLATTTSGNQASVAPWDIVRGDCDTKVKYLRSKKKDRYARLGPLSASASSTTTEVVAIERASRIAVKLPPLQMVVITDSTAALQMIMNTAQGDPTITAARPA